MNPDYEILRSVSADDLPKPRKRSDYGPLIKSVRTLAVDEGIKVSFKRAKHTGYIQRMLRKKFPHRWHVVRQEKSDEHEFHYYILRTK